MAVTSRVVRSVSCAAIIGLSLGVSAPGALAQDTEAVAQAGPVNKANIDFTKQGSITLHKKKGAESGNAATGQTMEGVPGEALPGVTYKITKLDYNLQTDNWADFPQTVAAIPEGKKTNATQESTTGDGGTVAFTGLDLGLYLVEETKAPNGIVAGAPFIVSVPMVNEASDAWNYDVVAYPKNTETKTEKTVKDADKNIQDEYTYTINADAPTWRGESKLKKFVFTDTLDPRLEFQEVTEVKAGETALGAGDYAVTQPSADNDNTLTVSLTDAGLAKVNSGAKMSLTFGVKRKEVGATTELKNQGQVIFNNPNTGNDVENTTNEVVTYHGKLKVVKKDGEEAGKVLQGAEFELYQCTSAQALGDKLTVKGADKWTTGEDGTVTIDGLHATDFADNKEVTDTKKFCLKETKAPAGYALPETPVTEIDFKRENIAQISDANGDDAITLVSEINNIKRDTPNLPMTGGAGVGILAAIGAAIVAAGVWFARRSAKN
ncbi:SpaH/EbpB family LPXTG-anchored major pilin [Corynebacterium segmentosum]|uniref:Surface-anchored fimbrial subunit n=1 Tax=Corynebacterium segmentosum TaxID=43990 RepID=A0ABY6TFY1_9CORY|nr:SpaH/EbpB family LPXTG-anchored major pilin [Corynebacterium segmentosum]VEH73760.1 putative surface-anchored fimbrial subunit [Corynebacterium segmentosum]